MPWALTYGVPYELFWHLNPRKIKPFKQAYQNRLESENHNEWLSGLYIKAAIGSAVSKKVKYPDKPFGTTEEVQAVTAQSAEIAAKKFDAWAKIFNEKFNKAE